MADIYIKLKGGGFLKWTGIDEVRHEPIADASQYYLGETYRDTGFNINPSTGTASAVQLTGSDGQTPTGTAIYRVPDEVEHVTPRTKKPYISMTWGYLSNAKVKTCCVPTRLFAGTSFEEPI